MKRRSAIKLTGHAVVAMSNRLEAAIDTVPAGSEAHLHLVDVLRHLAIAETEAHLRAKRAA